MSMLSMISAIVALLSGVTGLILFAAELRGDGKLGKRSRVQSAGLIVTLVLTAIVGGAVWSAEHREKPPDEPVPPPVTDTITTIATHETATHDAPPVPPKREQAAIHISGPDRADVAGALNDVISTTRRQRSVITGRVSERCQPDHVFATVTACDHVLDLTIRDLVTGAVDGATLKGEGVGSTVDDAANDAHDRLIARIRSHFAH
jgi:hypothetical protein